MQHDTHPMALPSRQGHFRLESGHHGERWYDLGPLFLRPSALQRPAAALAEQLSIYRPEVICGPLTGGAFLAQLLALRLDIAFVYTERVAPAQDTGLYTARYQLPTGLRAQVNGKRVAIVDDIINAGSAIRATEAAYVRMARRRSLLPPCSFLGRPQPPSPQRQAAATQPRPTGEQSLVPGGMPTLRCWYPARRRRHTTTPIAARVTIGKAQPFYTVIPTTIPLHHETISEAGATARCRYC
jgi:orotate phosphoribosyltransferase